MLVRNSSRKTRPSENSRSFDLTMYTNIMMPKLSQSTRGGIDMLAAIRFQGRRQTLRPSLSKSGTRFSSVTYGTMARSFRAADHSPSEGSSGPCGAGRISERDRSNIGTVASFALQSFLLFYTIMLTPMRFPRVKAEGQSFYHCVSRVVDRQFIFQTTGHGSRFVLSKTFMIQDPSLFVCYPHALACLQTQTSCILDPNSNLVFFHLPSYLTCPSLSPQASYPR